MRRRGLLVGAAAAAFGGCSTREGGGIERAGTNTTPTSADETRTATDSASPSPTPAPRTTARTETGEGSGATGQAVESAREHLAVAFDELREMRPVGAETIRVSADRFRASDHERVREEVSAATTALDRIETVEDPEVRGLRAAVDLAREGVALYGAVRRGFRGEWRFERHGYRAEWADASERASRAAEAIVTWEDQGQRVAEAAVSVRDAGGAPIPRLVLNGWYRDGTVLSSVAGSWADIVKGFGAFAEAIRTDEAGIAAMDAGEHRRARERFGSAAEAVGEAHRRLARAKADDAQAFQAYALPIRRRCGPLRKAYTTQFEAATAAVEGESDRAEELETRAMDRIVTTEIEHPLPEP